MMKKELNDLFIKHFSCIKDPRIEHCKRHLLLDILVLSLCAVMSGAEQWIDIEAYGQEKEAWLKTLLVELAQLQKAGKEFSKIQSTSKDEPSSLFFNQRRGNELGNQLEKACEEIPENQSTLQEEPLSMQNTYRKVS